MLNRCYIRLLVLDQSLAGMVTSAIEDQFIII